MTTLNRGYEKPDVDNPMASDCQRLQNALDAIDTDVHDLLSSASSTYIETRASALLDTIKTVDGPGSGLDADTLDGIQGAGFTLIAHTGAGGTAHSAATSASAGFMTTAHVESVQLLLANMAKAGRAFFMRG